MASWLCSKCGTQVEKDSMPTQGGCPSGGSHSWRKL